ncbi:hypothetical protein Ga0074812_101148 [Parafrankia irregularis]|uniref:Hydroxyneurosporene synthase (CrtC) n=1 Tax=Parafrankia irregularis TaxID=795642 RepID=A0A0S4QEI8_9ACTN|nr:MULTISPECIES: hypothetical protein [Parafrankia]MBE3199681.1 hypothetical protein [Parafrankia sp. CH37]CUU53650.1 hypothetical protein Ga0074812_101148 [Parafrankia irregularis]
MSIDDIGKLTPADEFLDHQIADTFATVVESDFGWTQKIWGAFARKDGSISVAFGVGKYHNRNVFDGFAGVSRGREQWTVRASRRLDLGLQDLGVGPIRYEVVDPLKAVRFRLDANDTQPISFDILFEGELSPFFEKRSLLRSGNRIAQNVVRYHQCGRLSGWVEVDGERHIVDDGWFGARDHSWGMRGSAVGAPPPDLQPSLNRTRTMRTLWGPALLLRPDGSKYELMHFLYQTDHWQYMSAHLNEEDGKGDVRQTELRDLHVDITFESTTRRFEGATYTFTMPDGAKKAVEVRPLGPAGFYLRTGQYGRWKDGHQAAWRGDYHTDGEYLPDVLAELPRLGQFRDLPVEVRDGDAVGYGIQESIYLGVFPELGLDKSSNYPIH